MVRHPAYLAGAGGALSNGHVGLRGNPDEVSRTECLYLSLPDVTRR
jgi:hypothetical protein